MNDVNTLIEDLTATNNTLSEIDSKLDEVKEFIATLEAGSVTPEQLAELKTLVAGIKEKTGDALAEADALDEVHITPTPEEDTEEK